MTNQSPGGLTPASKPSLKDLYSSLHLNESFEALRLLVLLEAHLYSTFEFKYAQENFLADVPKYDESIFYGMVENDGTGARQSNFSF